MGILILESIGPNGERLAMQAGELTETAVGYDPDLACATFDSETLADGELEAVIVDALSGIDPEWRSQLKVAE